MMTLLVRRTLLALFLLSVFPAHAQQRGELLDIEEIAVVLKEDVRGEILNLAGSQVPPALIDLVFPLRYDVRAFRVVYGTIDGLGQPTIASGLATLPVGAPGRLAMVTYHHGTFADDASAPSNLGLEAIVGYALASNGFLGVLPDYLGFGASPLFHPYVHAKTQATAAIDMMRAVRAATAAGGIPLNGQTFLTGYSQGGHAAVGTHREIEQNHASEFNLVMTAAGSGPYSLANIQARYALNNPTYPTRWYLPYLLLGHQTIYGNLYSSLSEVFVPPYDTLIPTLFDRVNTAGEINRQLPAEWRTMFQPAYINAVETNPFHPVRRALRDNDLLNFTPQNPLIMMYCTEDEQVDFRNAVVAQFYYRFVRRSPALVRAVNLGPFDHGDCIPLVLVVTYLNFASRVLP